MQNCQEIGLSQQLARILTSSMKKKKPYNLSPIYLQLIICSIFPANNQ